LVINVRITVHLAAEIMFALSEQENVIAYLTLMVKLVQNVYLVIMDPYAKRNVPIIVKTIRVEDLSETVQKDVKQVPCLEITVKIVLLENMAYIVRTIVRKIV
jgi:hypothetical protein